MHYSFLCLSGARTLAGNCSGNPIPRCSVSHYLFPTQWQHEGFPPLIYQHCVCSQRLKQLGCFADMPSCWWAEKLQQEVCFWLKHCCYTPDTMDMPGSQCNVEPNRPMSSFFILVITVSVSAIWSFLWYLKVVTLFLNLYLLIQLNILGPATFKKFVILCCNIIQEALTCHSSILYVGLSVQLFCTCNNEMSPSSVYGNSVQNCSIHKYVFLCQLYK